MFCNEQIIYKYVKYLFYFLICIYEFGVNCVVRCVGCVMQTIVDNILQRVFPFWFHYCVKHNWLFRCCGISYRNYSDTFAKNPFKFMSDETNSTPKLRWLYHLRTVTLRLINSKSTFSTVLVFIFRMRLCY